MRRLLRILVPCLIAALHITSFFLPACNLLGSGFVTGWQCCYLLGLLLSIPPGPPDPLLCLVCLFWFLPNPLCWMGLVLLATGRQRLAAWAGAAGTLAVAVASVWMFDGSWGLNPRHLGPGYYFWVASFFLLGVVGLGRAVWSAGTAPAED